MKLCTLATGRLSAAAWPGSAAQAAECSAAAKLEGRADTNVNLLPMSLQKCCHWCWMLVSLWLLLWLLLLLVLMCMSSEFTVLKWRVFIAIVVIYQLRCFACRISHKQPWNVDYIAAGWLLSLASLAFCCYSQAPKEQTDTQRWPTCILYHSLCGMCRAIATDMVYKCPFTYGLCCCCCIAKVFRCWHLELDCESKCKMVPQ